ncbi:N-terminal EF-hand calcium-binding protein 2 [Manis javanica]|nr:N-terminal EF-hand calcium-binding protein 2 [Manis javanica]
MTTAVFLGFIALSLYLAIRSRTGRVRKACMTSSSPRASSAPSWCFSSPPANLQHRHHGRLSGRHLRQGADLWRLVPGLHPAGLSAGLLPRPHDLEGRPAPQRHHPAGPVQGPLRQAARELIVAGSAILFLLPWGQLQFTGLVAALKGLGWNFQPLHLLLISAGLAFTYIAISGVRASAYIAILKDILMVVAIIATGVAVGWHAGVGDVFAAASAKVSNHMTDTQLRFSRHHAVPGAGLLHDAVRRAELLHGQEFAHHSPHADRHAAVHADVPVPGAGLVLRHQPEPGTGIAQRGLLRRCRSPAARLAAGAGGRRRRAVGPAGAGGICLAIGPIVARNLLPGLPEAKQKQGAKVVIVIYLLLSIVMTLLAQPDADPDQHHLLRRDAVLPGNDGHPVWLAHPAPGHCPGHRLRAGAGHRAVPAATGLRRHQPGLHQPGAEPAGHGHRPLPAACGHVKTAWGNIPMNHETSERVRIFAARTILTMNPAQPQAPMWPCGQHGAGGGRRDRHGRLARCRTHRPPARQGVHARPDRGPQPPDGRRHVGCGLPGLL